MGRSQTLSGISLGRRRRCFAAAHSDALIRVYDEAGNVIETHEHVGEFKEW
jgi:hypothetical protein